MLNWLNKFFEKSDWFLRLVIYPLITPLFVVINYVRIKVQFEKWGNGDNIWVKMFLVVSAIYLLFTFGFGIYWIIKNIKDVSS